MTRGCRQETSREGRLTDELLCLRGRDLLIGMPQSWLLRHEGADQYHLYTTLLIWIYKTIRLFGPPTVQCGLLSFYWQTCSRGWWGVALTSTRWLPRAPQVHTWSHHMCPCVAHVQVDFFIHRLFKGINDLGHDITVAVFKNCTDLQMKNTFTLKPLDRLVCAELKLSYIHKLSAPQETEKNWIILDGFTARVKSLNLKVGKSEWRPQAITFYQANAKWFGEEWQNYQNIGIYLTFCTGWTMHKDYPIKFCCDAVIETICTWLSFWKNT